MLLTEDASMPISSNSKVQVCLFFDYVNLRRTLILVCNECIFVLFYFSRLQFP